MTKKAGMKAWKKKRRQEYLEQKEYRYYIFCEGQQTETHYFNGFKKYIESNTIYKNMVLIEIEPCGAETMRVIGQAEEYVRNNKITKGQIWCVYDKDSFPAERFNGVLEKAEALNTQNEDVQYHAAWSNECIEFCLEGGLESLERQSRGLTIPSDNSPNPNNPTNPDATSAANGVPCGGSAVVTPINNVDGVIYESQIVA